jgi:ABC-type transport system involved in multi-copper enzyme maturation permease subunit
MNAASHGQPFLARAGESGIATMRAVLLRELRGALVNRYFQVFSVLALGGGISAIAFNESPRAATFLILQLALYFVSLFALLVGVSSARAEDEEWPILFAQPVSRFTWIAGKFIALWGISAGVLALLFIPALFSESAPAELAHLYFHTLGIAAVFGTLGLWAGVAGHDRVQALVIGVAGWLVLLFGVDFLALFAAQFAPLQKLPNLWVALLMANPLDAFRIEALFSLGQIPPETANKTPLAGWWLSHASLWFAIVATAVTGALLFLTCRKLNSAEL